MIPITIQRSELTNSVITKTQDDILESLDREYEKAKVRISETKDLRILKSYGIRIQTLNKPRGRKESS